MLTLIDGPCKGTYMCHRAPVFLRAVIDGKGDIDCLDQVEDTPAGSEKIYVYKLEKLEGTVHIHAKKASGWYPMASYWFMAEVDGEVLRDNEAWQTWATAQAK